ncbi:hypothetical protein MT997_01660 [Paenibacillus sp. OVF10]|nr:hypothetical protein MT997_01660 [Paenibacillus sp. OVF10]
MEPVAAVANSVDRLTTMQVQAWAGKRMNGSGVNGMVWIHVRLLPDPLQLQGMKQVVPLMLWSRELLRWLSLTEVWCLNRQ